MILTAQSDLAQLGEVIRQRRKELGWQQGDLGKRASISPASLSTFERAGIGLRLDSLLAVLRAIGYGLEVVALDQADAEAPPKMDVIHE